MTTNDYQQHQDLIQDLVFQLDELAKDNAVLTVQLKEADTEIASLKRKIRRLEGGQLELFVYPMNTKEDSRLDWQFHHQAYRRKTDKRIPKYH